MMRKLISCLALFPFIAFAQQVAFDDASMLLPGGATSDHSIGIADMNGDGKDDIIRFDITSESPNGVQQTVYAVLQGDPGATMQQITLGIMNASGDSSADTWGMSVADLDGNGRNDFMGGGFYNGVYIFKSNADNSSYSSDVELDESIYVQGMCAFDVNNDGATDLFVCGDNEISEVLINDGNGNLSSSGSGLVPATDTPSDNSGNYGACFSDIDNNGHADLYIAKCRQGVTDDTSPLRINLLYMNDGADTWTSEGVDRGLSTGAQSWCADFGDLDNDGDMDVFVANHDELSDVYLNDGSGFFTEVSTSTGIEAGVQFTPIQSSWVDFDNDGFVDLIVTGIPGQHIIAMNNGDGTFEIEEDLFGNFPVNSYALGDLNDDGFVDVYHSANGYGGWGNENFSDRLYLNQGNSNNFIKVHLTGVESNLNGIGARVTAIGPWGTQIRDIKAGESYGIQNSMTQIIGMGNAGAVETLMVTWPSGIQDIYTNVAAGSDLNLIEGEGSVGVSEFENIISVDVYPNPSADVITWDLSKTELSAGEDIELRIYDVEGKVIDIRQIQNDTHQMDISHLSTGVYRYSITSNGKLVNIASFMKQ
jgi:hypothetical protein